MSRTRYPMPYANVFAPELPGAIFTYNSYFPGRFDAQWDTCTPKSCRIESLKGTGSRVDYQRARASVCSRSVQEEITLQKPNCSAKRKHLSTQLHATRNRMNPSTERTRPSTLRTLRTPRSHAMRLQPRKPATCTLGIARPGTLVLLLLTISQMKYSRTDVKERGIWNTHPQQDIWPPLLSIKWKTTRAKRKKAHTRAATRLQFRVKEQPKRGSNSDLVKTTPKPRKRQEE